MSDITKCSGGICRLKDNCWRYLSPADTYQSFFARSPYVEKTKTCRHFWKSNKKKYRKPILKLFLKEKNNKEKENKELKGFSKVKNNDNK